MPYQDRLARIIARARWAYRAHHAVRGGLAVGIVVATGAFLALLAAGLGFVQGEVWRPVVPIAAVALGLGALWGSLRPLGDGAVLSRLDTDHGLGNALSTARELLAGGPILPPMAEAHVRSALGRAEALGLARTVTSDLGARARILGILCLCIVSVALI